MDIQVDTQNNVQTVNLYQVPITYKVNDIYLLSESRCYTNKDI